MPDEFEPIRSQISQERRADSEELEELTHVAHLRAQTLTEALSDSMAAGSVVTVFCADRKMSGILTAVVNDLAVLDASEMEASIHLRGPVSVALEEQAGGGTAGSGAVRSFVARLKEFELSKEQVELVGSFGVVGGRIDVVADGHVRVSADTKTWLLPLTQIGIALRPSPPSPSLR